MHIHASFQEFYVSWLTRMAGWRALVALLKSSLRLYFVSLFAFFVFGAISLFICDLGIYMSNSIFIALI